MRRFFAATSPASLAILVAVVVVGLGAPAVSAASEAKEPPRKELGSAVAEALGSLRALTEAGDHAGALALIDQLSTKVSAGSYDAYVLAQVRAQVLLVDGRQADALEACEHAFRLVEAAPAFVEPGARLEQLHLLAQLHAIRAAELTDPRAQRAAYERALDRLSLWRSAAPQATAEASLLAASVLYQLATLDGARADTTQLRAALAELREARILAPAPTVQTLTLLAAVHLQLNEPLAAAEWFELIVERAPTDASAWAQLSAIYLSAAAEAKKPAEIRRLHLRALATLERAQAAGQLRTPRDHHTRVALLFNLGQYALAAEGLERGLADGSLDDNRRNWELLASAYSQLGRDERAAETLGRAVGRFPADGGLEFSLAQSLHQQGRLADAYAHAASAVAKPGLERPGQARAFVAYLAYELKNYAEADRWIVAARAAGDAPADSLEPLARAVAEALRERES